MIQASPETIAIVRATLADVEACHAEIMLRMWYHLLPYAEREAVFADFDGDGTSRTMLQALIALLPLDPAGHAPSFAAPPGFHAGYISVLMRAFRLALRDVLGDAAGDMVVNAWDRMLTIFLETVLRPGPRP